MAATKLALRVVFAALLLAGGASAKVYLEWRPRMSFMAGYNDNVLLNGTGADGVGQAVPGIKLDIFGDHALHVALDCEVGLARLAHPESFGFSSGSFAANATYAQDPFSIAGFGLLLRPGQNDIFVGRFSSEIQHALSGHSEIDYGVDAQALAFGAGDPGNGYMLSPRLAYAWKTSARSKWDVGVREQLFFGVGADPNPRAPRGAPGGLLDQAHSLLLVYTYALTPLSSLTARAGC